MTIQIKSNQIKPMSSFFKSIVTKLDNELLNKRSLDPSNK